MNQRVRLSAEKLEIHSVLADLLGGKEASSYIGGVCHATVLKFCDLIDVQLLAKLVKPQNLSFRLQLS